MPFSYPTHPPTQSHILLLQEGQRGPWACRVATSLSSTKVKRRVFISRLCAHRQGRSPVVSGGGCPGSSQVPFMSLWPVACAHLTLTTPLLSICQGQIHTHHGGGFYYFWDLMNSNSVPTKDERHTICPCLYHPMVLLTEQPTWRGHLIQVWGWHRCQHFEPGRKGPGLLMLPPHSVLHLSMPGLNRVH
jgi:hypothetical protein